MYTTLNKIRAHSPCADGWTKLLKHLGKVQADAARAAARAVEVVVAAATAQENELRRICA